jgi:cytidine deaminase
VKEVDFEKLYSLACEIAIPRRLTEDSSCGGVGAVLQTDSGNIYKGVCIDTMSSMGFCAEHAAAGAMVTAGESHVIAMVAVNCTGEVYYPCGRCREFINQLHNDNINAKVMVSRNKVVTLKELLPYNV